MKKTLLTLASALLLSIGAQATNRIVTENDEQGNLKRVIELQDNVVNGDTLTDTLSITTYENSSPANRESYSTRYSMEWDDDDWGPLAFNKIMGGTIGTAIILSTLGVCLLFLSPIIIIILVFYFRNKKRKQQYRLMEQALAAGQPLPESFLKKAMPSENDIRVKGFRNLFLGIGLFIFLLALTREIGLACVGALISAIGIGQLAIYYTRPKNNESGQPNEPRPDGNKQASGNQAAPDTPPAAPVQAQDEKEGEATPNA